MRLDDHVAYVDAHPEDKAPVFGLSGRQIPNAALKILGRSDRFDRARELGQEPVARVLDDAAPVFRNGWLDSVRQKGGQARMRAIFVIVH